MNQKKLLPLVALVNKYLAGWNVALKYPKRFAQSIINIATYFDLDGVNLDWQPLSDIYPWQW